MKLNVKIDGQSFAVEVGSLNTRPIPVMVDGETFEVWPEQDFESFHAETKPAPVLPVIGEAVPEASPVNGVNKTKAVLAPIPGVIVSVSVKEGDTVSFGQELCVLEAMKMKNMIRANRAGKIAAILCAAGDQVRHSQVLMEYTD